jgi:hypothetical protein
MEALMARFGSRCGFTGLRILAGAIALVLAQTGSVAAIAIGQGIPGPEASFRLFDSPSTPADGFSIAYSVLTGSASFSTTGPASTAAASLRPVLTDGASFLAIGANIGVAASAPGTASAEVVQHVMATITNIQDTANTFHLIGFYGIHTVISVSDLSHESVFATWNVGLEFESLRPFREVRVVNCDLATFTPSACPNIFDFNIDSLAFITLDPDETFDILLTTDMTLNAVAGAVSEPASLLLFAAACLAAGFWRGRLARRSGAA